VGRRGRAISRYLALLVRRIVFRFLLIAFVGLAAALGQGPRAHAATFQPTWSAELADPTPGVSSDVVLEFGISAPDFNFSRVISFVPPQFEIADGDSIPNGAFSGIVTSHTTLGLLGNPCNSNLDLTFQLMDASTDPSFSIPPYDGVYDNDGDGLPENVDRYPALMSQIAPDIEPVQRLYGQTLVAGSWVPLNFVVFAPGTQIPLLPAFDASLGYATVAIVGDPFSVPLTTFPVTDFCTPLANTIVLNGVSKDNPGLPGNQGGHTLRTNPPEAGVYNSIIFARSQWDTDGDGIENNIDPCPLTLDPGWNPRVEVGPGDADGDGLPDSCDPLPSSFAFNNDGDGYPNRGDYCPTVATNSIHWDQDHDTIGDDCDPFPDDETNNGAAQRLQLCVSDTFVVGSPASLDPPPWSCPDGPDLEVPPGIEIYPGDGVEVLGKVHSVYVSLDRAGLGYDPAAGVTVDISVSGANTAAGSCLTSNGGDCEFNYAGVNAGTDTITATATVDGFPVEAVATNEWIEPPPNDDFSTAASVPAIPFEADLHLVGATNEEGEPPCGFGGTVWYSFTPNVAGYVAVETATRSPYIGLGAYQGSSLEDLQSLACGGFKPSEGDAREDRTGLSPGGDFQFEYYIGFRVQAGQTYYIQVATFDSNPDLGTISLDYADPGDANCSGSLTALDALEVLRKGAGLTASDCVANGNMNCDDVVNAVDALLILRVVAGISDPPGGCLFPQN
jgi:hypothetical protein